MSKAKQPPKNLLEAIRYFSDIDVATEFVANLRWPNGPVCPRCGSTEHSYLSTRRLWKCKGCKKQYSVKLGTIFEDSPLGFDKWLPAIWLTANSKNGISSHELARALGITQKSSWFMLHRIRLAMQTGSFDRLSGEVEADETYIGGAARNMHASKRKARGYMGGRSTSGKTAVAGIIERGGQARATVVPDVTGKTLKGIVHENVAQGSTVYTDNWKAYFGLSDTYAHEVIDHAEQYVDGRVHTNGIENFWSLLKRGLHGTYVSVAPFHLFRYLDERVFTFNKRDLSDFGRFALVLSQAAGRRLTYEELTDKS
jgi:transposase-like protein